MTTDLSQREQRHRGQCVLMCAVDGIALDHRIMAGVVVPPPLPSLALQRNDLVGARIGPLQGLGVTGESMQPGQRLDRITLVGKTADVRADPALRLANLVRKEARRPLRCHQPLRDASNEVVEVDKVGRAECRSQRPGAVDHVDRTIAGDLAIDMAEQVLGKVMIDLRSRPGCEGHRTEIFGAEGSPCDAAGQLACVDPCQHPALVGGRQQPETERDDRRRTQALTLGGENRPGGRACSPHSARKRLSGRIVHLREPKSRDLGEALDPAAERSVRSGLIESSRPPRLDDPRTDFTAVWMKGAVHLRVSRHRPAPRSLRASSPHASLRPLSPTRPRPPAATGATLH